MTAEKPPASPRLDEIHDDRVQRENPFQHKQLALQEGRMVLPGIQTLLGFQMTAVFNAPFSERLPRGQQTAHFVSMLLIATAMALVITPAPYNHQVEPGFASRPGTTLASRLTTFALVPLTFGVSLDVQVIGFFLFRDLAVSVGVALGVMTLFVSLWFVFPRWSRRQRIARGDVGPTRASRE